MGYPKECDICLKERSLGELGEKNLKLTVRPFQQARDPKVMLVGLNPTLIKKKAKVVLELDDSRSQIYRFVNDDVLTPAGITPEKHVYATNLVKCTFSKEPRIMSEEGSGQKGNEAVKELLSPFFKNCRRYFEEEIKEMRPRILISFGEKPHQMITEEFGLAQQGVKTRMKDAFGKVYPVNMLGVDIVYAPCIRVVAKNRPYFANYWGTFIKNLRGAANQLLT
jgi:uracil-DNA glycosylase